MQIFPFADRATLVVSGADCTSFLQGQLTQDLAALGPEQAHLAAMLTPGGRALAIMRLVARDGAIVMIIPADVLDGVAATLRRFVLRAKVSIHAPGDALAIAGVLEDQSGEIAARFGPAAVGTHLRLADGTSLVRVAGGALLAAPAATLAPYLNAAPEAARWERIRVAAGEPIVSVATREHWTAQMLNLDRLGAISFTKGCYTGQEIVARTQHLGRIKRRMLRFRAGAFEPPAPAAPVLLDGTRVGEVVRGVRAPDGAELLAVVNLEARGGELKTADGARLVELPLPYPLD